MYKLFNHLLLTITYTWNITLPSTIRQYCTIHSSTSFIDKKINCVKHNYVPYWYASINTISYCTKLINAPARSYKLYITFFVIVTTSKNHTTMTIVSNTMSYMKISQRDSFEKSRQPPLQVHHAWQQLWAENLQHEKKKSIELLMIIKPFFFIYALI